MYVCMYLCKIIKSPLNIKLKNHIIIIQTLLIKNKQLRFGDRLLLQRAPNRSCLFFFNKVCLHFASMQSPSGASQ